jgi:hypothetical protein
MIRVADETASFRLAQADRRARRNLSRFCVVDFSGKGDNAGEKTNYDPT